MRCSALALCLLLAACAVPPDPTKASALRAGAAQAVVEVPVGHSHGGFSQSRFIGEAHPPDDPKSPYADIFPATRAIESPIVAKAVWIENATNGLAIVKLDTVFTTPELYEGIVRAARAKLGVDLTGALIVNASHSHNAPGRMSRKSIVTQAVGDFIPEAAWPALAHGVDTYSQDTLDRFSQAAAAALAAARESARPAKFGWATRRSDTTQEDRRCANDWLYGKDDFDRDVTVLRFDEAESGAPIAVLFHHAFHPTVFKQTSRSLSTDAAGHAEYRVEQGFSTPVVAVYLQGAAGGVGPMGAQAGHRGTQAMERLGWDLARTVMGAYETITPVREVVLQSKDRWMPLDKESLGYDYDEFHEDGAMLCGQNDIESCATGQRTPADMLCLAPGRRGQGRYFAHVTAARLNDLVLLTLPGEPVPEVGKQLDARARGEGFAKGVVLGYSQDHHGYILLKDDWLSGGYEPTISFWGWRFGDYVSDQSIDTLRELRGRPAEKKSPLFEDPDVGPVAQPAVALTDSTSAPGVVTEVPERVERLSTVRWTFTGGDPGLGTPQVRLEREEAGTFTEVLRNGWIPVSNRRGGELPTFYRASPSHAEAPTAAARRHEWEIVFEPDRELALGTYRLVAELAWREGGEVRKARLDSQRMVLGPATSLRVEAAVAREGGRATVALTLLYPDQPARFSGLEGSEGWQVAHFRLIDGRFGPERTPVLEGRAAGPLRLEVLGAAPAEVSASFLDRPLTGDVILLPEPGESPGFRAEFALAERDATLVLPPGSLTDPWGNTHGRVAVSLAAP
jgi:hypothetical protein